jgi:single-stranded-DNA-specific exonuclease
MAEGWVFAEREQDTAELVKRLGVTPITAHLLVRAGYQEVAAAKEFLEPTLLDLLPPEALPNMDAATARLEEAIREQHLILLFGDYDVDGNTGAAILEQMLSALGAKVEVHIPNRDEGYGLGVPRLQRAKDEGVRLVISIDNGIAAIDEAKFMAELGLDLIVADHHTMGDELPVAVALIHPQLPGSTYPNPHLCGAGVAFKLAWGTAKRVEGKERLSPALKEVLLRCLSLVALGTVADVVSLTGENRALVRHGLKALAVRPTAGMKELLRVARVDGDATTTDVAFRIAPRLNAAGRMGDARRAYRLLVTEDASEAKRLAEELDEENKRRREVQARVYAEAKAQVLEVYGEEVAEAGIVVWDEGWPHGVVGIVAAKLTETFKRPALIASVEGDGKAKGSGRSVAGVNLLASLESHRDLFERMGGHAAAVGFTIGVDRLSDLRRAFDLGVKEFLGLAGTAEAREIRARLDGYEVEADVEVRLDELSRDLMEELERMEPFGQGNPEPLFAARDVTLAGAPKLMGKTGAHVSFMVRQGDRVIRTVAFGRRELWEQLNDNAGQGPGGAKTFEVAFRPRLNRWRGQAKLELELKAIRFQDT